jgi:hypothetical protein
MPLTAMAVEVTGAGAIQLTSTQTGVDGESLSDDPVTDAINMHGSNVISNQLAMSFAVTPGTSATVTITCDESDDAATWLAIPLCDAAAPSNCAPDRRTYTLADWSTVSGVKYVTSRWYTPRRYARCKISDASDGSGTVVVTGSRSWQ